MSKPLSVIVISRGRPQLLALCLAALAQQTHPDIEVVLVADPGSVGIRPDLNLKRVSFDQPNVSAARNQGLALAAGEIVAFIDDDATAFPNWAAELAAGFDDPRVLAATGFTLGPWARQWQAKAERIGADGLSRPFALTDNAALPASQDGPVSTIGTNCAFRRDALLHLGGFDPAFAYYLDESDVNWRMSRAFPDALTAIRPQAQVIHGIAAGPLRTGGGVPSSLHQVGHSTALFTRRHQGVMPDLQTLQRKRLLRHMVAGRLDPFGIAPLLTSLRDGMAEGQGLPLPPLPVPLPDDAPAFLPLARANFQSEPLILAGWIWQARSLRQAAISAARDRCCVALLLLSPTAAPHRLSLKTLNYWEQTGGFAAQHNLASVANMQRGFGFSHHVAQFRLAMARRFTRR